MMLWQHGLRAGLLLTLSLSALLTVMQVMGGWARTPQLTLATQTVILDPRVSAPLVTGANLLAYDVQTGQTSALVSGLGSLPVAWRWSPNGDRLGYVLLRQETNDYEVWVLQTRPRRLYRIVEGLPFGAPPEWSPDGTRIALVTLSQDICLYAIADDPTPSCLNVLPAGLPAWSPDGHSIAYVSRLPDAGLYRVEVETGAVHTVLAGARYLGGPRWSPDGAWLVFSRQDAPGEPRHLYRIAPDGSGLRQLTSGSASQDQAAWSPDGLLLAYNEMQERFRTPDVVVMDVQTGQHRRMTTHPQTDTDPRWSPDGQLLAYVTDRYDGRPRLQVVPIGAAPDALDIHGADGLLMYLYVYEWRP
jgi:Tol biopolymer transport system component